MEILIGTTNPSKIKRFTSLFSGYDVRLHTLRELGITAELEETGGERSAKGGILQSLCGLCDLQRCWPVL
ncbi:MAG: hypothetical protein LUF84_04570 [Clostridiales bacterium]|nr:hypothetical protein [Clostridiales bacterium]